MNPMPTWEEFMIHELRVLSDGVIRTRRELYPLLAAAADLTDEQAAETLPSGQRLFENRIGWGLSFLTNVGALDRPARATYGISDAGRYLLNALPDGFRELDINSLGADPASPIRPYVAKPTVPSEPKPATTDAVTMTPTEQVQTGIERIHDEVAAELLSRLQQKDPGFFEQAVVDLLLAMGYGGTSGKGTVTQLTNDGGIDGVIDQDVLGLRRVYIQAKRYAADNVVHRPDLQAFVGALQGKADSGVFITSSRFSDGARQWADAVPTRIILVDGKRLADLMIRYGVGVQVRETYKVVEIDEDFFA